MTTKSLDMNGAYDFSATEIDAKITKKSPGNYALGYRDDGKFCVRYVGRSDSDLNARLKKHLGNHPECTHFKYSYATSPKAAFEKECQNWHDFTPPENKIHPDQPSNSDRTWTCPGC